MSGKKKQQASPALNIITIAYPQAVGGLRRDAIIAYVQGKVADIISANTAATAGTDEPVVLTIDHCNLDTKGYSEHKVNKHTNALVKRINTNGVAVAHPRGEKPYRPLPVTQLPPYTGPWEVTERPCMSRDPLFGEIAPFARVGGLYPSFTNTTAEDQGQSMDMGGGKSSARTVPSAPPPPHQLPVTSQGTLSVLTVDSVTLK